MPNFSINVVSEVFDVNSKVGTPPFMTVKNSHTNPCFVVLEIEGKKYTVNADAMKSAIENATNIGGV